MPRVSATGLLKPIAAHGATAIVRFVRRAFAKGAAAGGALAVLAGITLALLAAATPSGDFLFLPRKTEHRLRNSSTAPAQVLILASKGSL